MPVHTEFFQLFDMTPDLVCIAGKDGYFKKINRAVINTLGYTEQELLGRPISEFVHPDDRETTDISRRNLFAGTSLTNFENRYVGKSGAVIWLEWTSIYHPEKELVFAIAKDVSKRKESEKKVLAEFEKYRSLAAHFKTSMEEDRRFLAAELHEEMAQLASIIKMNIDWVSRREQGLSTESRNLLAHAISIADLLIQAIRRITFSIGSAMLGHVGLRATLDWQCREFAQLNGLPCTFVSSLPDDFSTSSFELDFLRITQEALTSVMLNTELRQVGLALDEIGTTVYLTIQAEYKIIINRELFTNSLTRIRERASSINASCEIIQDNPEITLIRIMVSK
jgi:PAS domain S-box-containing protein